MRPQRRRGSILSVIGSAPVTSLSQQILNDGKFVGLFPGWGGPRVLAMNIGEDGLKFIGDTNGEVIKCQKRSDDDDKHGQLTSMFSISLAGSDLMSSCLYTAGVCATTSGKMAPIGLILVTMMLFCFRRVYSEIVTAIPLNGGTYNIMLNTTSKKVASVAACLSLLSYTATAIISAFDAIVYLSIFWPQVDLRLMTVVAMLIFGCVTICGVSESSSVTFVMFVIHMATLTLLIIWSFAYGIQDNFEIFHSNINEPLPDVLSSSGQVLGHQSIPAAIYFGYCSALLGITGFESAANYVEDLKDSSVFVTTVDWLWVFVGVYNPLLSVVSMCVLPMSVIRNHPGDMLAVMANTVGGNWFKMLVCADAVIVLCGAVLTGIVGVSGLLKRLAQDKVLPSSMAYTNSRGASYISIICFVGISISLFLSIFDPKNPTAINNFGGVYAIAFLAVLVAFASAAMLLKLYRPNMARLVITKWWQIFVSLAAVATGLVGNILLTPQVFVLFLLYLCGFLAIVAYMFMKVEFFSFGIWMMRKMNLNEDKRLLARKNDEEIYAACTTQAAFDETRWTRLQPNTGESDSDDEEDDNFTATDFDEQRSQMSNIFALAEDPRGVALTRTQSVLELENINEHPIAGKVLSYLMTSLDSIVGAPFVYLAKTASPISLQTAMEYIVSNELSNNIYVVHFMDDRDLIKGFRVTERRTVKSRARATASKNRLLDSNETENDLIDVENGSQVDDMLDEIQLQVLDHKQYAPVNGSTEEYSHVSVLRMFAKSGKSNNINNENITFDMRHAEEMLPPYAKELIDTVALLDTFYTRKKMQCMIVRGAFFCPEAVSCVAQYLGILKNSMIMGVPDTKFPFPFANLKGVRLAVPRTESSLHTRARSHMHTVLSCQRNALGPGSRNQDTGSTAPSTPLSHNASTAAASPGAHPHSFVDI